MMDREESGVGRLAAVACLMVLVLSGAWPAKAQTLSVEETETLVRSVYYEGMPEEQAARIGPAGCARLVEMLATSEESRSHGQILVAIGICGPPGGFEAIRDWADMPRVGEIDRATFRAWQALPYALGHLARRDRRALARLETRLNDAEAPSWTFRHHRGARLVAQSRRSAATGLALTGLSAAREALDRAEARVTERGFRAHLEDARRLHRQSARAHGVRGGVVGPRP